MITATKTIEWDMGHRIPNHDSKCRNPHGHRYKLEVTVTGKLIEEGSSEGMVIDFSELKNVMSDIVNPLDHAFMFYVNDTFGDSLTNFKALGVEFIPTAENIAEYLFYMLQARLKVKLVKVKLYETPNSFAEVTNEG